MQAMLSFSPISAVKRWLLVIVICSLTVGQLSAQGSRTRTRSGKCGSDVEWTFDGHTLTLTRSAMRKQMVAMADYNMEKDRAPWIKQNLDIRKVVVGPGIGRIGSCAFAGCSRLTAVEFRDVFLREIGWGAFLHCKDLFNFSMPVNVNSIGSAAFAGCSSLTSVRIPSLARVDDMAFLSCTSLSVIELGENTELGQDVFATEVMQPDGTAVHRCYNGEIRSLPRSVNADNCTEFGLDRHAVEQCLMKAQPYQVDPGRHSQVDTDIPSSIIMRNDTYALIIGNENYRSASHVPFAINDAKVFAEYCLQTLGIPATNLHLCIDATKYIFLEQELNDWLQDGIPGKRNKKLIVYYAGHGVPDVQNANKSYLLPTDVPGAKPSKGIALDWFYETLGNLGFSQVTVFVDACFSGVNRNDGGVTDERAVEVEAQDARPTTGNLIVFSAAQGNETAQSYRKEGHGLFTYYLLKELQECQGMVTYGKLADTIKRNVRSTAVSLDSRKQQNPQALSSRDDNEWRNINL